MAHEIGHVLGLGHATSGSCSGSLMYNDSLKPDRARIDSVRFGAVKGTVDSTTGSYFLDEHSSFR